jgi:hypothetical protein
MFINGELVTQGTNNSTLVSSGSNLTLGGDANGDESVFTGYISDARIVKGTAVYTAAFTPPTAPLTAVTNTAFLLNPNPNIIDKAQTSNLQLVGNTTGSTTQVKFAGTNSIYFDGSGDYLRASRNSPIIENGDFTVECWLNPSDVITSTYRCICSQGSTGSHFRLFQQVKNLQMWTGATQHINYNANLIAGTWYHIAFVATGSNLNLYINGSSVASVTLPAIDETTFIDIGGNDNNSMYGYMTDFRISNGLARYTNSFTPSTTPLLG